MKSLGVQNFLCQHFRADGTPTVSIICTRTLYERRDGSRYFMLEGKRHAVERCAPVTTQPWPYEHIAQLGA